MNRRSRLATLVLAAASTAALTGLVRAEEPGWRKIQLTDKFYAEGMAAGDFNKDGKMDVVYGPYWWEGPDFKFRHQIFKPTGKQAEGSWKTDNDYSHDAFFAFVYDFNNDGYPDYLVYGFPGEFAKIYTNPGKDGVGTDEPWKSTTSTTSPRSSPTSTATASPTASSTPPTRRSSHPASRT